MTRPRDANDERRRYSAYSLSRLMSGTCADADRAPDRSRSHLRGRSTQPAGREPRSRSRHRCRPQARSTKPGRCAGDPRRDNTLPRQQGPRELERLTTDRTADRGPNGACASRDRSAAGAPGVTIATDPCVRGRRTRSRIAMHVRSTSPLRRRDSIPRSPSKVSRGLSPLILSGFTRPSPSASSTPSAPPSTRAC